MSSHSATEGPQCNVGRPARRENGTSFRVRRPFSDSLAHSYSYSCSLSQIHRGERTSKSTGARENFGLNILSVLVLLILAAMTLEMRGAEEGGTVAGVVVSAWDGTPLSSVVVTVRGTTLAAQTGLDGRYELKNVPPGDQVLRFSKSGFATAAVTEVRVINGQTTSVNGNLRPEFYEMEEYEVTAEIFSEQSEKIILERQKSSSIMDALGSDFLARVGAGDAAEAISKVSGATLVEGKFAVIRGLSDRYTSAMLNGAEIPSADPYRKAVQLDLFPSSMIDRVEVSKTFTVDQPGGFTGGSINIVTKSFPDRFQFKLTLGAGYDTAATGNPDFLTYDGGKTDWLGFDDGTRALPKELEPFTPETLPQRVDVDTRAEAEQYSALLNSFKSQQMGPVKSAPPPNSLFGLSFGDTVKVFDRPLGYVASLSYDRKFTHYEGVSGRFAPNTLTNPIVPMPLKFYSDTRSADEVQWGSAFNLAYELNEDHLLNFVFVYAQNTEDFARQRIGFSTQEQINGAENSTTFLNELHYTERQMHAFQLRGEHNFPDAGGFKANWLASLANTTQSEPDLRIFNFKSFPDGTIEFGGSAGVPEPGFPTRYFRELEEDSSTYKLDLTYPVREELDWKTDLKFGGYYSRAERTFDERTFSFRSLTPEPGDPFLYPNQFLRPEVLGFRTTTNRQGQVRYAFDREIFSELGNNHYDGHQSIYAGYLMPDMQIVPWLRFVGGVRYEVTDLEVSSTARNQGSAIFVGSIQQGDVLPAAALIFTVVKDMNVRLSYGRTVARPTFRELSPYGSYDVTTDEFFVGNPNLEMSSIDNLDIRWEWFFRPGQLLAVSGFYKDIKSPIEKLAIDRIGDSTTFTNSDQATVLGVELEARSKLDVITPWLQQFSVGFNFAWIFSEVENPANIAAEKEAATGIDSQVRPLYDQSPYVLNTDLSYDNIRSGTRVSLAFYQAGERLFQVNPTGYDVYEQPAPQLDFVMSQDIGKHLTVKFSAKNLLDPEYKRIYGKEGQLPGEFPYSAYHKGRTFTLALTYSF